MICDMLTIKLLLRKERRQLGTFSSQSVEADTIMITSKHFCALASFLLLPQKTRAGGNFGECILQI